MKGKRIRKIFNDFFKQPNPIFCYPVMYFRRGRFLCEVASTESFGNLKWNKFPNIRNPLWILEGLFVDSGFWITVLEQKDGGYEHRTDLSEHICSFQDLARYVPDKLDRA